MIDTQSQSLLSVVSRAQHGRARARSLSVLPWLPWLPWLLAASGVAGCSGVSGGAGLPGATSPAEGTPTSTPASATGFIPSANAAGSGAIPGTVRGTAPPVITPPPSSNNPSVTPANPSANPNVPVGEIMPPTEPSFTRVVPTDERPAIRGARTALPVSGGTLLISRDGTRAIAADPERDRVSIVDIASTTVMARVVGEVALQAGDEPGRLIEDDAKRVHVVLRHAGAVASIDLASNALISRRVVCAAPRGIVFEASTGLLHVACTGGELVSLAASGGEVSARAPVDADLRDVLTTPTGLVVTRAKSAELLRLDAGHKVLSRTRADAPHLLFPEASGALIADTLEPELARRTITTRAGGFVMLHQGARNGDIELQGMHDPASNSNPYGGAGTCRGVVTTEVTVFDGQGKPTLTAQVPDVLAVDVAESPFGREIAIAVAGVRDPQAPVVELVFTSPGGLANAGTPSAPGVGMSGGTFAVQRYDTDTLGALAMKGGPSDPGCGFPTITHELASPATAVAFLADGRLAAQTREPASLWIFDTNATTGVGTQQVALGGVSVLDTGHELFHRDAGAGVACASCHLEGGDDGHVWHFVDQGPRRTQSIAVGLEGTAPFHWVGDMDSVSTLMENVFVGRMGGVHQTPERSQMLEHWMYSVRAPVPLRVAADPAAVRGGALFAGEAECAKCHSGPKLTNNQTVDVGTGLPLQVPSLVGVAHRGPWLHTGCAATLRARFDAACGGGDAHGHTLQLTAPQVDDLVAYLETL